MSEITKQEGEFKMPKPKVPKSLNKENKVIKVDLSTPKVNEEITKVVIPNLTLDEDAVQKQSTTESMLRAEQPEVELREMEQRNEGTFEDVIQEITDEEVKVEVQVIE